MKINRFALATISTVLIAGAAVWTLEPGQAQDTPRAAPDARLTMIFGPPSSVTTSFILAQADIPAENQASTDQAIDLLDQSAVVVDESLPIERLSIVRQSIRRAGLGSRAIATLVLRNENEYAVKDIGVRCAFARIDGQGSTERVRMIERTLKPKSRAALPPTLIGHINVMAPKGKCSLVSASRA
jgi:hypothetical protein